MTITIRIKTDNAAFNDADSDKPREIARIARVVAEWLEHGRVAGESRNLKDINGNTVWIRHGDRPMTGDQANVVIAKIRALKVIRAAIWDASEKLSTLQTRELNTAADCLSAVINDLEATL